MNHNASNRPASADCRIHGPNSEPHILSITPALPGWSVAVVEPSTGQIWTDPVAAWALVEAPMARDLAGCSCTYRGVHAMVAGSHGALEVMNEATAYVVPPGTRASWSAKPHPHWLLSEIVPGEPAKRDPGSAS